MEQTEIPILPVLIEASIACVRTMAPADDSPYYGCFSGGKDSVVLKHIVEAAGVPVEWHYNVTTIDPPEVVRFIRDKHPNVLFNKPPRNFFRVMEEKGFPTRRVRWCCLEFKEKMSPIGSRMLLGIRAAESPRRAANWKQVTFHRQTREYAISPLLYWRDDDVWAYIRENALPYCSLYNEGFNRLGCIGCPMAGTTGKKRDFDRWPGYKRLWKRAFQRIWDRRTGLLQKDGRVWFGDRHFSRWEEMWDWWLLEKYIPNQQESDNPCIIDDMLAGTMEENYGAD